jgi:hypothetical protein
VSGKEWTQSPPPTICLVANSPSHICSTAAI